MTTDKLKKLELIVKPILEECPAARDDDFYLYSVVCGCLCPKSCEVPLFTALRCHKELGLPNYESVSRVRRRLQAKYPELESERTKKRRQKMQEVYSEYAVSV